MDFWANFPIFPPFFPLFPGGVKIHFSAIFFPNRAGGLYRAIGIAIPGSSFRNNLLSEGESHQKETLKDRLVDGIEFAQE